MGRSGGAPIVLTTKTNLVPRSDDFSSGWSTTNATVVSNQVVGPDGNGTVDFVKETVTNGNHLIYPTAGFAVTANTVYSFAQIVKANGRNKGRIQWETGSSANGVYADYDLGAGTIGAVNVLGSGTAGSSGIDVLTGGYYRVWVSGKINAAATTGYGTTFLLDDSGSISYAGDVTKGQYCAGAALTLGSTPAPYIATNGAARTAAVGNITSVLPSTIVMGSNPVLTYGAGGQADSSELRDCCIVKRGSTYYLWYTGRGGANPVIMLATASNIAGPWTKQGVVLPVNPVAAQFDSGAVFSPSVYDDGTTFTMYYTGTLNASEYFTGPCKIGIATSTDGVTWTRYGSNPVLVKDQAWEGTQGIYSTSPPITIGGVYQLYYSTSNSATPWNVGRATSSSLLGPWTKQTTAAAILADAQMEEPYVVSYGGLYFMAINNPADINAVNLYVSSDGVTWYFYCKLIGQGVASGGWNDNHVGSGALIVDGGTLYVFFDATSTTPSTDNRIGYAVVTLPTFH
jgi:predicted GH43/DUF377 family glycosyl hydrolase